MRKFGRRSFFKTLGLGTLAAGSLPASIARALAIPANDRTGTIEDIEHIVILMQENRSFDHYFGTLRGVRGFGDPRAVTLPSGKSVWYQPSSSVDILPFRPPVDSVGSTFLPDPPHGWNDTHAAWNNGKHDRWIPNKGVVTMTYETRKDIPYQYALADAFTICDAYHCSLLGPTDPNRYHMWTGWVGNDGKGGGPVITNAEVGYDWSTYPERLEKAGISWKIYQDIGKGLNQDNFWGWTFDEPYGGNYGDNSLLYFHQYQNALFGNPLADKAKVGTNILNPALPPEELRNPERLLDIFREDVRQGKLPQVSWIVAPEAYTEHPNWIPDFGTWYVSQFIDILISNPDLWSKAAFFLTYDEEGGFFDHQVPPTPPQSTTDGKSTVDTINEIYGGDKTHPSGPYGLGMRVPMIVISPWSKGGWVNSELFDHTSLIRFIEARFGSLSPAVLREANITPWRRSVVGDLTSAFDFSKRNSGRIILPGTDSYKPPDFLFHPDYHVVPPASQALPKQEPGVRPARALPYELHANGQIEPSGSTFRLDFVNTGNATAVYQVRSADHDPRTYTIEAGKSVSDIWNLALEGIPDCDLSVYGPNGFFRSFKGSVAALRKAQLLVRTDYDSKGGDVTLVITNRAAQSVKVSVLDMYKGKTTALQIGAGATLSDRRSLSRESGWYDFAITTEADASIEYHVAGHVENGKDSISDPAIGSL